MAKEDLLELDAGYTYDEEMKKELEQAFSYAYPYESDTGLYTLVSVSELKKQSQTAGKRRQGNRPGRGRLDQGSGRGKSRRLGQRDRSRGDGSKKQKPLKQERKKGRRFMAGQAVLREVLHTTGRWNVFPSMNCTAFQIQKRPCFRSMSRDIWIRSLMSGSTPGIFGNLWKARWGNPWQRRRQRGGFLRNSSL